MNNFEWFDTAINACYSEPHSNIDLYVFTPTISDPTWSYEICIYSETSMKIIEEGNGYKSKEEAQEKVTNIYYQNEIVKYITSTEEEDIEEVLDKLIEDLNSGILLIR